MIAGKILTPIALQARNKPKTNSTLKIEHKINPAENTY